MSSRRKVPLASAWFVVLAVSAGCGPSGPPVHTVKGKVTFKGKGHISQLTDGKVWLQSTTDADLRAVGSIEDDGSFTLGSFLKDKELQGVPAGTYKARVQPPRGDDEG